MNFNFVSAKKSRKQIAFLMCVLIVVGSLILSVFVFTHPGHEHDTNGPNKSCTVCVYISTAENLLRSIAAAVIGAAFMFGCMMAVLLAFESSMLCAFDGSLVRMKVKLSN